MCGIAGVLLFDGGSVDAGWIEQMNCRQAHRGPDGEGLHVRGPIGLGHRRLAIMDPAGGHQPLLHEERDLAVVANGEIYNFRELRSSLESLGHHFKTGSDCEVILHGYAEWGEAVVARLRGMFAFAVWDGDAGRLFLARDRLGIKPLCYARVRGGLAFASELQALRILPGVDLSTDVEAVDRYLHLGFIPAPSTIHRGITKLLPAHTVSVDIHTGHLRLQRYWQFHWQPEQGLSEEAWISRLDESLSSAVESHLMADVPFGAFLSGGVDSSTVAAYATQALKGGPGLRTFTVGFAQEGFDERQGAADTARQLGTLHHDALVDLDTLTILPQLVHHYGEPFADSSAVCTWRVCELASQKVKMMLSGDGGDEVFTGYPYFPKLVQAFPKLEGGRRLRRLAGDLLRRLGLLNPRPTLPDAWYDRSPYFNQARRLRLWKDEYRNLPEMTHAWNSNQFRLAGAGDTLSRCQSVDLATYLPYDNLTKVDIASMAHGLEVRVPLLDHRLLETVAAIPPSLRLARQGTSTGAPEWCGKYLLKRTAERFFPWEMLERPKRGFSMPISSWFAGPFGSELPDRLLDSSAGLNELFNPQVIQHMVEQHRQGQDHSHRLWALLMLAEWRRQMA